MTLLLQNRADVNIQNNNDFTPRMSAASNGHFICMKVLIQNGADVKMKDDDDVSSH